MRVMVTSWAAPTHYFPMVPLALALRTAGHDVCVVTQPSLVPAVRHSGLPAVATAADMDVQTLVSTAADRRERPESTVDQPAVCGVVDIEPYVRLADLTATQTLAHARRWRPDLVMYEPTTYAGPLTAAALGVPAVRHLWGVDYMQKFRRVEPYGLAGLCARLDLVGVETHGDLTVDCCPASMQAPPDPYAPDVPRLRTRYVPYNGPAVLPAWLVDRPRRRRVCVTWGTTGVSRGPYLDTVRRVVEAVAGLDVDVVVTLSAADAADVGPVPANVRLVSMLALNLLLPTCDAVVFQGGLGTMMTATALGVPALVIPQNPDHALNAGQLAGTGAGQVLPFAQASVDAVREATATLLASAETTRAAKALAAEMAGQTALPDAVRVLESLAVQGPRPRPAPPPARRTARPRAHPPARAPRALVTLPRWSTGAGTAMVPFAWALRAAGFEVLVATTPEYQGPAARCGLPTAVVGRPLDPVAVQQAVVGAPGNARAVELQTAEGLASLIGVRARMALPEAQRGDWAQRWKGAYVQGVRAALTYSAGLVEDTVALARAWRPDYVVFGPNSYGGPLAAAVCGVPAVRHLCWADQSTVTAPFEEEAVAPLWSEFGLGQPDLFGALTLDPCPPALRLYAEYPHTPVRFVPYDDGVTGRPASTGSPTVCVSIGSPPGWPAEHARTAATVLDALAGLDVDVLALVSPRDREEIGRLPDNARLLQPQPLPRVLAGCAAFVTAGEPDALLTAIASGCPALVLPQVPEQALRAHLYRRSGAGEALAPSAADPGTIRAAVQSLIEDGAYRIPLRRMRTEMTQQPRYADVVPMIQELR